MHCTTAGGTLEGDDDTGKQLDRQRQLKIERVSTCPRCISAQYQPLDPSTYKDCKEIDTKADERCRPALSPPGQEPAPECKEGRCKDGPHERSARARQARTTSAVQIKAGPRAAKQRRATDQASSSEIE